MNTIIRGNVHCYGDNIDTDLICPGRYLELKDPYEIASHALCGLDPDFPKKVKEGDIIVAGKNFGCGSSREHGVIAIKYSGIKAVIAKSFAKIYYRNAINQGLYLIYSERAEEILKDGDRIEINLLEGNIRNLTTGVKASCNKLTKGEIEIAESGGMIEEYKRKANEMNKRLGL